MPENSVKFSELCKTYKTRRESREALRSLTLDIPKGQIFGFAGPNGAGKSTAIKILVGLVKATSGSVSIFGHSCGTLEARSRLGFLPEVTLYHEFMGVEELLKIHATLAGLPSKEHKPRVQEVLELVGLWERRRSRINEFSKGMKQRFGIALALLGKPELLVLDELTSGLDPQAQANLLNLLAKLKEQHGLTIFFSSHHLEEIEKICNSVAILHQGVLRASGPLDELLGDGQRCTISIKPREGRASELDTSQWEALSDGCFRRTVPRSGTAEILRQAQQDESEIVELRTDRQSLEALFHQLTTEESAA